MFQQKKFSRLKICLGMWVQRYVLQLDRCIYQRLAKEDVCSIDQIEPRRVCFGVKEEALLL